MRVIVVLLALAVAACTAPPPPPEAPKPPPPAATTPPPPAPPAPPPPPPPGPPQPEPAGITAGGHKIPDAPKGKGMWVVDPATTDVSFTIVSNSAGPITGKFPGGAAGAFDAKKKKGVFTIDLTKMASTNKAGVANPARDINVVESFFGARPFANPANKAPVDAVWAAMAPKIKNGVALAGLVIDGVEGAAATPKDGAPADGVVNGKLILWESVEIPVSFPVTVTKTGDTLAVKGTAPATFNIEKATGTPIRNELFNAMLAAGCAHQPGIQNDVSVSLDQVTLKLAK